MVINLLKVTAIVRFLRYHPIWRFLRHRTPSQDRCERPKCQRVIKNFFSSIDIGDSEKCIGYLVPSGIVSSRQSISGILRGASDVWYRSRESSRSRIGTVTTARRRKAKSVGLFQIPCHVDKTQRKL